MRKARWRSEESNSAIKKKEKLNEQQESSLVDLHRKMSFSRKRLDSSELELQPLATLQVNLSWEKIVDKAQPPRVSINQRWWGGMRLRKAFALSLLAKGNSSRCALVIDGGRDKRRGVETFPVVCFAINLLLWRLFVSREWWMTIERSSENPHGTGLINFQTWHSASLFRVLHRDFIISKRFSVVHEKFKKFKVLWRQPCRKVKTSPEKALQTAIAKYVWIAYPLITKAEAAREIVRQDLKIEPGRAVYKYAMACSAPFSPIIKKKLEGEGRACLYMWGERKRFRRQ